MKKTASFIALYLCLTGLAHASSSLLSDDAVCHIDDNVVNEMNITLHREMNKIKTGEELGSSMMIDFTVKCKNISIPGVSDLTPHIYIKEIAHSTTTPGNKKVYNTNIPGIGIEFISINTTENDGHPELLSYSRLDNVSAGNTGIPIRDGSNPGNELSVTGNNDTKNNIYPPLNGKYKIVATMIKTSDEANNITSTTNVNISFSLSATFTSDSKNSPNITGIDDYQLFLNKIKLTPKAPDNATRNDTLKKMRTAYTQHHLCQSGGYAGACQRVHNFVASHKH